MEWLVCDMKCANYIEMLLLFYINDWNKSCHTFIQNIMHSINNNPCNYYLVFRFSIVGKLAVHIYICVQVFLSFLCVYYQIPTLKKAICNPEILENYIQYKMLLFYLHTRRKENKQVGFNLEGLIYVLQGNCLIPLTYF